MRKAQTFDEFKAALEAEFLRQEAAEAREAADGGKAPEIKRNEEKTAQDDTR